MEAAESHHTTIRAKDDTMAGMNTTTPETSCPPEGTGKRLAAAAQARPDTDAAAIVLDAKGVQFGARLPVPRITNLCQLAEAFERYPTGAGLVIKLVVHIMGMGIIGSVVWALIVYVSRT